ncbi:PTS glucose transporter subunit IIA [Bacillus sp. ISL-47]|uniref:PTS sugar transporter subunit IIA n=1 Tax=Bacillus sp. ISL-47 TaxID=2819130 RepID=UPI001BE9A7CF|nr:PTS glucose transporter subunit IIA [Bacillus sp. ISL-47]MBT2690252.1 PTS glucose transporter subunit IIA [Bacillus sp. ISL-47]MBT2708984.1 PTS glucose transporter subunit IIA [Pseudomonas sp. ISL-84]
MFKKLFGKKETLKSLEVKAALTGTAINLEEVPDPVFAEKMMGDGVAIEPSEGVVVSPVNGEIMQVFPTKHAIGIRAENGAEILIHIGLETVSMKGEGFETHVSEGTKVNVGEKLVTFDLDLVKEKAKSTVTPIIVTNGDKIASLEKNAEGPVTRGNSPIMTITAK